MIAYYLITAVLTFINLMIFIFSFDKKRISAYFTFMALLMVLANGGYLALALSTNLQEAVLANKIIYLGGCFVPPILLISICVICNYKVADWLRIVIYTYSFLVYAMVLTIGHNHLYYSEIFLDKFGNSTVLGHEYGIGHNCLWLYICRNFSTDIQSEENSCCSAEKLICNDFHGNDKLRFICFWQKNKSCI